MSSKYRKFNLIWDTWNLEHIKKHNVSKYEVEIAFKSKDLLIESYRGRILIIGRSKRGRILTISISFEKQKDGYVVSARDSSKKERELYYDEINKNDKTNKTI
ncbi:MAG: hypothetical protein ACD_19C00182G0066 [uncultured bacterium]|nr:MAG: hypothetical protein ACD_19C00182G0066 [uncultured bacterium]